MSDITDLREHLFGTLRDLRDKEKPLDVKRAMAIANVAQAIIHTAKVEVDHMKLTGAKRSAFIPEEAPQIGVKRLVKGRDMQD